MLTVKAAVFPVPDWLWPMRFCGGLARSRGSAFSWILDGFLKPAA
jgi:hypothetical protein